MDREAVGSKHASQLNKLIKQEELSLSRNILSESQKFESPEKPEMKDYEVDVTQSVDDSKVEYQPLQKRQRSTLVEGEKQNNISVLTFN